MYTAVAALHGGVGVLLEALYFMDASYLQPHSYRPVAYS